MEIPKNKMDFKWTALENEGKTKKETENTMEIEWSNDPSNSLSHFSHHPIAVLNHCCTELHPPMSPRSEAPQGGFPLGLGTELSPSPLFGTWDVKGKGERRHKMSWRMTISAGFWMFMVFFLMVFRLMISDEWWLRVVRAGLWWSMMIHAGWECFSWWLKRIKDDWFQLCKPTR